MCVIIEVLVAVVVLHTPSSLRVQSTETWNDASFRLDLFFGSPRYERQANGRWVEMTDVGVGEEGSARVIDRTATSGVVPDITMRLLPASSYRHPTSNHGTFTILHDLSRT
jgi:hypothetical protein